MRQFAIRRVSRERQWHPGSKAITCFLNFPQPRTHSPIKLHASVRDAAKVVRQTLGRHSNKVSLGFPFLLQVYIKTHSSLSLWFPSFHVDKTTRHSLEKTINFKMLDHTRKQFSCVSEWWQYTPHIFCLYSLFIYLVLVGAMIIKIFSHVSLTAQLFIRDSIDGSGGRPKCK